MKRALLAASIAASSSVAPASDRSPPSFYKDVLPVLQQSCQVCHHRGGANNGGMVAPMAFTSYEEVRPWAKALAKQVSERTMPPWHAAPEFWGQFKDERVLSDAEIATLVAWVDAGAPRGNPADAPPAIDWPSGDEWFIGEPDLVIEMPEAYEVGDDVTDIQLDFPTTITRAQLPEPRWIKSFEFRPGSDVVHHILASPFVGGAVPGCTPYEFPDGVGARLEPGQKVVFSVHYHKEAGPGTGVTDRSSVAVKLYPRDAEVKFEMYAALLNTRDIEIAPGESRHVIQTEYAFEHDSRIVHFLPHMHLRGAAARYEAFYPDGRAEVLLDVPRYDFYWQHTYQYREPRPVPAGTVVRFTAVYDNSADNPLNPDPAATVRWGRGSNDEMCIGKMWFVTQDPTAKVRRPSESTE